MPPTLFGTFSTLRKYDPIVPQNVLIETTNLTEPLLLETYLRRPPAPAP